MKVTVKKVKATNGNTYWLTPKQSEHLETMLANKQQYVKLNDDTVPTFRLSITTATEDFDIAPDYFKKQYTKESSSVQISDTETDRLRALPKAWIILDFDMNIINSIPLKLEREGRDYIDAQCHYHVESNGERSYILDKNKIAELNVIRRGSDGYYAISEAYHYGVERTFGK